ncbi:hypothetical protein GYMLUDRAFT_241178 [Collybiopsis luxurians FD-317 M1]|uniref:Inhibitor I9 domain-containing protein n=1 Tax=Collybiopsis luxurians FD-317 M1 TaxID=944289 RepID=A0A0D0BIL8_9AGAR|nr:hypothetical protein GYMLUDRAFT_241178 [Collybiopsis luxurians FD-317 M1]
MKLARNLLPYLNIFMVMLIASLVLSVSALPSTRQNIDSITSRKADPFDAPLPNAKTLKVGQFNKREEAAKVSIFTVEAYNGLSAAGDKFAQNKHSMIIRVYDESCTRAAIEADYKKFLGQKEHLKVVGVGLTVHPDVSKDPSVKDVEEGEEKEARVIILEAVPFK